MPQLTLSIKYAKNSDLVFTASEIKALFFTGISLVDQNGNPIPEETINFFIEAAQKAVADALAIKLKPTIYTENRDYKIDDWIQWGYFPSTYMVTEVISLNGYMNGTLQAVFPVSMLSSKRQSDPDLYWRSLNVIPAAGGTVQYTNQATFLLQTPWYSSMFGGRIPNYWEATYLTGFSKVPADIMRHIGLMAAIDLFINLSDIIAGSPGVANKSIGIDGLNQSVGYTSAGGKLAFQGRIDAYVKELEKSWPRLRARYVGINLMTF
jgi:hypothetical protein